MTQKIYQFHLPEESRTADSMDEEHKGVLVGALCKRIGGSLTTWLCDLDEIADALDQKGFMIVTKENKHENTTMDDDRQS